jgi:transposase
MGVTQGAVSQWVKKGKEGGEAVLEHRPSSGSPRRLSTEERQRLPDSLLRGAETYGFRGNLWTYPRVAELIRREFGISYHPAHISRILKECGWSPQKPIRRAKQHKGEEIKRWQEERWLEVKKTKRKDERPSS